MECGLCFVSAIFMIMLCVHACLMLMPLVSMHGMVAFAVSPMVMSQPAGGQSGNEHCQTDEHHDPPPSEMPLRMLLLRIAVVIMPIFTAEENAITPLCQKMGRVGLVKAVFDEAKKTNPDATLLLNDFNTSEKYRELIADCLPSLCADGTLRICDLCCGKSYLSFAAYHYFCNVLGRKVRMTGVDLKPDVVAYCNEVARALRFDGLEFLCGDIGKYDAGEHVDLVISLHACDTATDLVLSRAMLWEADVILSTPCCHHELNHTINCQALSFVTEHSMLRQKLCDAATDAMRLKLLQANGYEVCALELIDPEETPKNIMLRALRRRDFVRDGEEAKRYAAEYEAAKRFLLG